MRESITRTGRLHQICGLECEFFRRNPKRFGLHADDSSMAGADSTSITMRSIFYFLMKHPAKLQKLRAEIDEAFENSTLESPAQYGSASSLKYLNAVVREATRLFPAFSVSQPRYVPIQGIELCGKFIPAGYSVGLNPAIIQHDRGVFGEDALEFVPERWLESEERTRLMDKAILGWGAGTRTCVGRPVSFFH